MNQTMPLSERQGIATEQHEEQMPSLSSLLGGIVTDMHQLLEEHLELLRLEVQDDFEKSKAALLPMAIGSGLVGAAGALLLAMLIGWLNWLYPTIPWFGWAGILAAILAAVGLILFIIGKTKLTTVNPIPEVTLQAVKESIQCISNKVKD
jgi:uncharacterized membrane protein YqjE